MDANDPSVQALFSAIRSLLVVVGSVITTHGIVSKEEWEAWIGAFTVLAPAAWGVWVAIQNYRKKLEIQTTAFKAGIMHAESVHGMGDSSIAPAITAESAHAIIAQMAPGLAIKP